MRYIILFFFIFNVIEVQAKTLSDIESLKAYTLMRCLQYNQSDLVSGKDFSYYSFEFVKNERLEFEEIQLIDNYVYERVKSYRENEIFLKNDVLPKKGNDLFYQCYLFSESKDLNKLIGKYIN